jgi:DNA helicase II / ATP-dependent DNA helicase PcrA
MDNYDIEFGIENEKLEQVKNIINEETINYVIKRKSISEHIVKYRKEAVEEFKDDEDKIAEYFDHERYISEEAFGMIDRKLKELTMLRDAPYFAKIVCSEPGETASEQFYIGRFGLNRENDLEPLIVDWRAPIASLYYAGKLGELSYKAPMGEVRMDVLQKRQFIIKKGKLEGMFDSSSEITDGILQMVLSKKAGDKLKDIIMTIQAEQDNLIRYDRSKTVVVDGVAGSGKTTIALHRVAYLLYNFRDVLQDKVMIIGPNNIFMDYISTVLPSLGEAGIKQATFREFALGMINNPGLVSYQDSMEKIANSDQSYIDDCRYKESEEFVEALDKLIADMDKDHFRIQDVRYYENVVLASEEIIMMFDDYFKNMPLFRRSKKIKRIILSKIKDESWRLVSEIQKKHRAKIDSLSEIELESEGNNLEYIRQNSIREVIREAMNAKKSLGWLENPGVLDIYNSFNGGRELTFEDLAPILYLSVKLEGLKVKDEIKHIVIDEAQDFSALQFRVLQELTGCRSFTVVGDSNQRLMPDQEETAMSGLGGILKGCDVENFKLRTSYRSTKQIMEFSNRFLKNDSIIPVVREGSAVEERDYDNISAMVNDLTDKISEYEKMGYESVAVICRNLEIARMIGKLIREKMFIAIFDSEEMIYKGGAVAMPAYFAKGLEFDCVINISTGKEEEKMKYVMATRALHEMCWYRIPEGGVNRV